MCHINKTGGYKNSGFLKIIVIEHDGLSNNIAVKIGKGTDGMAKM